MEDSYLKEYVEDTNSRVRKDPKAAVGGMWDEIGKLQFNFMINQGLKPENTLLDLGCGTLRAGIRFINYLNKGKYFGQDISEEALNYAKDSIKGMLLTDKNPTLYHTTDLKFKHTKRKYDYILAQSVFSHLPVEHIKECFENIGSVMHDNSRFYFTFRPKNKTHRDGVNFYYDYNVFELLAMENDFDIKIHKEYKHPRKQVMVECVKSNI